MSNTALQVEYSQARGRALNQRRWQVQAQLASTFQTQRNRFPSAPSLLPLGGQAIQDGRALDCDLNILE